MIEIIHKCQHCKDDGGGKGDCTCDTCLSEIMEESYQKGFADGKEEQAMNDSIANAKSH